MAALDNYPAPAELIRGIRVLETRGLDEIKLFHVRKPGNAPNPHFG